MKLGADTLCWHMRIERRDITIDDVLVEAHRAGAEYVQLCLHHVRDKSSGELRSLARRASDLGLALLASGDHLGSAQHGDEPTAGTARARAWMERAAALESPLLRVCSGFYRADLAGRQDAIDAERRWMVDVLGNAVSDAEAAGIVLAVENHSDFSAAEFVAMLDELGDPRVRVFLDLINPVSAFENPVPVVAELSPLAAAGHIKDYELVSIQTDDAYHRRGFSVMWRYPGEGAADLRALISALASGSDGREVMIAVEGLDNRADVRDQVDRLSRSITLVRELAAAVNGVC
jgi:sugar phosphate isomerase/epimerase